MMTPDKDFAQLVTPDVFMFKTFQKRCRLLKWGVDEVKQEFSVDYPKQVIDILALMGDTADSGSAVAG